jgi:hypothetical protein
LADPASRRKAKKEARRLSEPARTFSSQPFEYFYKKFEKFLFFSHFLT